MKGIRAYRAQSYASLERVAADVRANILPGWSDLDPVPGLVLFERLDDYCVPVEESKIRLQYAVESLVSGIEAQAYYSVDEEAVVVALSETTYERLHAGTTRALFTVGHELGHAVLHSAELVDRRLAAFESRALHRGSPRTHPAFMDTEWQANGFAAAMLMPARGLVQLEMEGRLDSVTVARTYLVSLHAAELRVKTFLERRHGLVGK
jgi:hypothetical protein